MQAKTDKTFDCIAFKRQAQAEHYERTRHMTDAQWLADLKQSVADGPLGDWWQRISNGGNRNSASGDTPAISPSQARPGSDTVFER